MLAARLSSARRRPSAYRYGANYRSYKPSAISWTTQSSGPQGDAYSTDPLSPAREAERCDNNQRNKPTYDQQGYTSAAGPASVSRTTCPLNIHEPPPYAPRKPRRGGERDVAVPGHNGGRAYCDSIDLSCILCRSIIPRLYTTESEG